jgi:hypothetical protein
MLFDCAELRAYSWVCFVGLLCCSAVGSTLKLFEAMKKQ